MNPGGWASLDDMTASHALLVTTDDGILEDVLRLAAAAGVVLDVAHDATSAVAAWGSAPLVLVGADSVPTLAAATPLRRERVFVVARGSLADALFRGALQVGAESVLELPAAESWLVESLTDVVDGDVRRAVSLAVVNGSGGAGATTFAAALALTAASPARPVTLLDADPLGGGLDRLVGLEEGEGVTWGSLMQSTGRFSARSLRQALPQRGGLAVLTWGKGGAGPVDPALVREVLSAAQRGSQVVVVDVPRYPDAVTADLITRCDRVILVADLKVHAVCAASKVVELLRPVAHDLHLVARVSDSALDPASVAQTLDVPLLLSMRDQRRLGESVELGLGPVPTRRGPLARAAREALRQLAPVLSGAA